MSAGDTAALPGWPEDSLSPRTGRLNTLRRSRAWLIAGHALAWVVGLCALAAALAVAWWLVQPQLDRPLAYDEAAFAFAGRAVAHTGIPFSNVGHIQEETPGDFSKRFNWALWHPPLYVYALGETFYRFGESERSAKMVGVACNAAATLLIFVSAAVMLAGRTRAAPIYAAAAGAVYALNPLVQQSALLLDIDGTVLVASIALMTLAYTLLLRSRRSLWHPLTWLLLGLVTFSFALSLWAKMTTSLALVAAAAVVRLLATRPWRPLRALVELPVVGLVGGTLFLGTWWLLAAWKGMPFWFPFRILQLELTEAAGSTSAWRKDPRILLDLVSSVALWISPYLIALFLWAAVARAYDLLIAPVVAGGRRLLRRPRAGEPWGTWAADFALGSGAAIGAAYLIKLAGSFPKYHISMMPFWAIAVAYLLYRFVPALSWWEPPVYGIVLAGLSGYFVTFVGDKYVLFRGWDFLFPLLVWPAALGFAFLVLGAALNKHHLPRQLAILGVLLTVAWSWGVDLAQSRADYSTSYNYGAAGQVQTAARLRQILRPGEPYVAAREVAYYTSPTDDVFVDQETFERYLDTLDVEGVDYFDGKLLGYNLDVLALFLWDPSISTRIQHFVNAAQNPHAKYDVDFVSLPYIVFVKTVP